MAEIKIITASDLKLTPENIATFSSMEESYRRGYTQGAEAGVGMLKARIQPEDWPTIDKWNNDLLNWRGRRTEGGLPPNPENLLCDEELQIDREAERARLEPDLPPETGIV